MLLQKAKNMGGGPIPNLFPFGLDITQVNQGQTCQLKFVIDQPAIAYGLFTYAAVVIVCPTVIALYHALAGHIPEGYVQFLLQNLQVTELEKVVGLYAVPDEWDNTYQKDVQKLVDAGIPDNNVITMDKIGASFGVNSMGQVGIPC
jgi:hypothetical protein